MEATEIRNSELREIYDYFILYCKEFNLPITVLEIKEESFKFSILGFTDQLIYKFDYHVRNEFEWVTIRLSEHEIELTLSKD